MTLDPLAALPALASLAVATSTSVESAFFRVYLPVLLLLPDNYWWGWPPLDFHQWAIVPIGLALCWWVINGRWWLSLGDLPAFGFISWMIVSDLHSNGTVDIVKRFAIPITLGVFPYMAGKLLIEQSGMRNLIAKRFAFFVFIDSLISVYEFAHETNPFRHVFGRFFSSVDPWFTQVRYGVGRTAGPFGHAILMGAILSIAILLHRYATHFGLWESRFRWFPKLGLKKSRLMLWGLVAGSIMTVSRGPWIAVVVGIIVASIGTAQNRRLALRRTVLIVVVGGSLIYWAGKAYVAGSKSYGPQEEVASAEYRTELWTEYGQIAMQQSFWGWGSLHWPHVKGMDSVDNWYLLVTIMYGLTGLTLFVTMLGVPIFRLIHKGMSEQNLAPDQRALLFTMSGILVSIGVAIATVFLGAQLYPILFLFLGWSEACLKATQTTSDTGLAAVRSTVSMPAFAFRKVIA